jgi:UDP-N-acetylglucosamine transferase subunit ALG13
MTKQISAFSFTVNPEAAASIHDDGIVILHTGKGRMFTSNEIGARIWRGIERQLPLEAIAKEISDEYQIARTTAREHAVRFLAELERHTLIQREVES